MDLGEIVRLRTELRTAKCKIPTQIENGKPVPSIMNAGCKAGSIVRLTHSKEYQDLAVRVLEDVPPMWTNGRMTKLLKIIIEGDLPGAISFVGVANLQDLIDFISCWFLETTTIIPELGPIKSHYQIDTDIHQPIPAPVQIIGVGSHPSGASVVPEDWLDRKFDSAWHLHRAIDTLPTRKNQPETTYCLMMKSWYSTEEKSLADICSDDIDQFYYIHLQDGSLTSWASKRKDLGKWSWIKLDRVAIGYHPDELLVTRKWKRAKGGLDVSRMQKAIRRGPDAAPLLVQAVYNLTRSGPYNLPQHNYQRTSSAKQLAWRLFICLLEDVRPYENHPDQASLLDLILLSLVTSVETELGFSSAVCRILLNTAVAAQATCSENDLPKLISGNSYRDQNVILRRACDLALGNITMMSGDRKMLEDYRKGTWEMLKLAETPEFILGETKANHLARLASVDQHCSPSVMILYQALLPTDDKSKTTMELASEIWEISSKINVRKNHPETKCHKLRKAQSWIEFHKLVRSPPEFQVKSRGEIELNQAEKKSLFLQIFGKSFQIRSQKYCLAGSYDAPLGYQKKVGTGRDAGKKWFYVNDLDLMNGMAWDLLAKDMISPPGTRWKYRKYHGEVKDGEFWVNGEKIPLFDGSSLVESCCAISAEAPEFVVDDLLTLTEGGIIAPSSLLRYYQKPCQESYHLPDGLFPFSPVMRGISAKVQNSDGIITCGPLDRSGKKTLNAVDYRWEGKIWASLVLLSHLFSYALEPIGDIRFRLHRDHPTFVHFLAAIQCHGSQNPRLKRSPLKIRATLRDHQTRALEMAVRSMEAGYRGVGNASDTGAGKTLASLAIAAHLSQDHQKESSGTLVLLVNDKLFKTWEDEIQKHLVPGSYHLIKKTVKDKRPIENIITDNTIVLCTLNTMRITPVMHRWKCVIIDECLSVKNKDALWTEEAWRQVISSDFLCMLSAIFFDSRPHQLYYLLKMLHRQIPATPEYVDTILVDRIVCDLSLDRKEWEEQQVGLEMTGDMAIEYGDLEGRLAGKEKKQVHSKLLSWLHSSDSAHQILIERIRQEMKATGRKCLIFTPSRSATEIWSRALGVPAYPQKGTHCVVSWSDGAHGLNDLVQYNTIISLVPKPGILVQMKGRLDRYGQTSDKLELILLYFHNTPQESGLRRLEISRSMEAKYMKPLADYYTTKHE